MSRRNDHDQTNYSKNMNRTVKNNTVKNTNNTVTKKYKVDKNEQMKVFDYVNKHLTVMENSCNDQKTLFTVKDNHTKVSIPEPSYRSRNTPTNRPGNSRGEYVYSSYHDFDCTICMENIKIGESVQKLKCGHLFHNTCLQWFHSDPDEDLSCPTCDDDLID